MRKQTAKLNNKPQDEATHRKRSKKSQQGAIYSETSINRKRTH